MFEIRCQDVIYKKMIELFILNKFRKLRHSIIIKNVKKEEKTVIGNKYFNLIKESFI